VVDHKGTGLALLESIDKRRPEASTRHRPLAVGGSVSNGFMVVAAGLDMIQRICSAIVTSPLMACRYIHNAQQPQRTLF
jgi:hypothetical protein